jgi:hypothetical protein
MWRTQDPGAHPIYAEDRQAFEELSVISMTREDIGFSLLKGGLGGAIGAIAWLISWAIYEEARGRLDPYFYAGAIPLALILGMLGGLVGGGVGCLLGVIGYLRKKPMGIFSRVIMGILLSSSIIYFINLAMGQAVTGHLLFIFVGGSFVGIPAAIIGNMRRSHKTKTEELGKISEK